MELSLDQIAQATGGRLVNAGFPGQVIRQMTWDSRKVEPGCLYVALPGARVDGHAFVKAAARAGAAAALVTSEADCPLAAVVVPDTAAALERLASYWRDKLQATVVGLTGSTGKTTTKNLVRDVLSAGAPVVATLANQNNELGVPNTLLAADAATGAVVVEMGMRGLGQISRLCEVARPDWGLITNVGESHIELLGSRDDIARAKAELVESLPEGAGIAFLNAADDYTAYVARLARLDERGVKKVFFDGSGRGGLLAAQLGAEDDNAALVWADDIALDAGGRPSFTVNVVDFESVEDGSHPCALALRGLHNVSNACSAIAVGLAAGLTLEQCCEALSASQPEQGRQQMLRASGGALVVDDSYNANPDSMKASLSTFSALDVAGRRIAVLGDMGELGSFAPECHARVGGFAADAGLDVLLCVGPLSRNIAQGARAGGMDAGRVFHHEDLDSALAQLAELVGGDDAVLVKASRFMEFETIVEGLVG